MTELAPSQQQFANGQYRVALQNSGLDADMPLIVTAGG